MVFGVSLRIFKVLVLAAIILLGILSRLLHSGSVLIDKYLGDALYAAMVYMMMRLFSGALVSARTAAALMLGIELFQLTTVPARMWASELWIVRICGRLLGTSFSVFDLLAYAVGIGCIYFLDSAVEDRWQRKKEP